jgi:hypothetical protein
MANRPRLIPTLITAALMAVFLPLVASAQGGWDWGRNRRDRDRDYGRYGNSSRSLRDAARRVNDRSRDFQRHLDSALDRSRYEDTPREDRINEIASEFRNAASNFRNSVDDGRDLNRSSDEARRLLQLGSRIDNLMARLRFDSRTQSDWSQIRQDLRLIANIYGINFNGGGYYGRNDGYYGRDDDYYGRGNNRNRRRDNRRNNDNDWRRRIPLPYPY